LNKRSLVLNLKSGKAVEALKRLVAASDVVVENFRPGVMDGLGIGYDPLREVNPGIVYASITLTPGGNLARFPWGRKATSISWARFNSLLWGTLVSFIGSVDA
jgi:hypothetical protein